MKKIIIILFVIAIITVLLSFLYVRKISNTPVYKSEVNTGALYTFAEVKSHNKAEDCYSSVSGNVYDFTAWINKHPGGKMPITFFMCGKDATKVFNLKHGKDTKAVNVLNKFYLGSLVVNK